MRLDPTLIRLLGCLIEKEMTTPDYYPMTINGLTSAANQRSNRNPVVTLTEAEVIEGVSALRELGMVRAVRSPGGRAIKYKHALHDVLEIDGEQAALLAVLFLRGEQTPGELRARTERYHDFPNLGALEAVLDGLQNRTQPLVERLARRPGEKEARYRHLLSGEAPSDLESPATPIADDRPPVSPGSNEIGDLRRRLEALEQRIEALEQQ